MSDLSRRSLLALAAGGLAGCAGREGAETGDTPRSRTPASTGTTSDGPECAVLGASMAYETTDAAAADGDGAGDANRTATSVVVTTGEYVVVRVRAETRARLVGTVELHGRDPEQVSRTVEPGVTEHRIGPFGHDRVADYEFRVTDCTDRGDG